jgi:hypothetical protein
VTLPERNRLSAVFASKKRYGLDVRFDWRMCRDLKEFSGILARQVRNGLQAARSPHRIA